MVRLAFRLRFAYAPSHFIESRAHGTAVGIDDGVIVRKISAKTKRVERSSYPELSKEQIGAVTAAIESIAAEPMYKGLTVHSGLHKAEQATRSLWKTAGE